MARRKTHEEFVAEVKALVGDEYAVVGEYEGSEIKLTMLHNSCHTAYETTPSNFKRGRRCPTCYGNKYRDTDVFKSEVHNLVEHEYVVLGDYVSNKTCIKLRHATCGTVYNVAPIDFLRGRRCPKCRDRRKHHSEFLREVYSLVGEEYRVVGEYKNAATKVKIRHANCGGLYETSPHAFLRGRRCPRCRESRGEIAIRDVLSGEGIMYDAQKMLTDCRDKHMLPFDFAIYNNRGVNILGLIEYDGEQHFRPIEFFGGEKSFKATQRRDAIKTKYCADNGIPLLRIPYTEFDNIEAIVTEWLTSLGKALQAA